MPLRASTLRHRLPRRDVRQIGHEARQGLGRNPQTRRPSPRQILTRQQRLTRHRAHLASHCPTHRQSTSSMSPRYWSRHTSIRPRRASIEPDQPPRPMPLIHQDTYLILDPIQHLLVLVCHLLLLLLRLRFFEPAGKAVACPTCSRPSTCSLLPSRTPDPYPYPGIHESRCLDESSPTPVGTNPRSRL